MDFLIVPAGQEASFTGSYGEGLALVPRPLADGRSALPLRLLKIEAALAVFPGLAGLSVETLSDDDFAEEEE